MDMEEKYCKIYDLDTETSAESYVRKLRELGIYLSGQMNIIFNIVLSFSKTNNNVLEREIENYKAAFHEHDEDGSGNISTEGEKCTEGLMKIATI